ncbi:MAG: STAS domain-containing protein [Polyangiaceae bacterium]|nr:STAS domain-containing protein [Polyangiaceae bacterium]
MEELRRQVDELKVAARRYHAIVDNTTISLVVYDSRGHVLQVNEGFEKLWQIPFAALAGYVVLDDPQLEARGLLRRFRHAFATGEPVHLPVIRYDPHESTVTAGKERWVGASLFPVRNAAGELIEAVLLHYELDEFKHSEDELRAQNEVLEAAVAERTRELSEHFNRYKEQQQVILELSTPVIRLWKGILALPLVGMIDSVRAAQVMENLLAAIVHQQASQVIVDVTGVPLIDTSVASHLLRTVSAAALLGAHCILVGISPDMAQTLMHLDVDFGRLSTAASLEQGLRQALTRTNQRIVAMPRK